MKKGLLIVGFLLLVAVGFGVAGSAYAQAPTPEVPGPYYEQGGRQMRGQGMMGGGYFAADGEHGPLHEVMVAAMAEALGVDAQQLEAELESGETMYSIAAALGFTPEEFSELMYNARQQALEQAVADGILTAEQAEWMQSRMQGMRGSGYGPGAGNCNGTGQPANRGMGSRNGRGVGMGGGR